MKYHLIIIILLIGQLYGRSGFGYTIGACSGGEFTLPPEENNMQWINHNGFMNGTLDYVKGNMMFSLGGRIIRGNLMLDGMTQNNDNELWSRFISFGFYDVLKGIEIIEKSKIFDYMKFSSSIIYSTDTYGWFSEKTTSSTGVSISAKLVSKSMWQPYISYEMYRGSYKSHLGIGISLFLVTDDLNVHDRQHWLSETIKELFKELLDRII